MYTGHGRAEKGRTAHRGRSCLQGAIKMTIESLETRTLLTVFANGAPISIPSVGAANPYPSEIVVSGLAGAITDVNVTLKGFSHTFPDDVDVLLVGPGGQKTILLSDAGENVNPSGANITLDDEAASLAPDTGGIPTGTYKPTDYESGDTFPGSGTFGPYVHSLAVFDGTNASGTWSLYVIDDQPGDSGTFAGGWELNITAVVRTWDGGGDGTQWTDPLNWSGDVLPSAADDVVIDVPGVQNIQLASGAQSIHSLTCQENLSITGSASLSTTAPSLVNGSLTVSGGAALNLGGSLTAAAAVNVITGGQVNLDLSGSLTLDADTLTIDATSRVDLADNHLIVRSGTLGSWDGTTYTGITGMVRSGRNGGAWNGNGIITSAASGNLTTLGVAEVAGDVVVKFTYGGDANLDGKINVDDYGHIDSNVVLPGVSGWFNGDFNYDGKINVDDYGIIDSNVPIQGPPLGSASAPADSGWQVQFTGPIIAADLEKLRDILIAIRYSVNL
jgi:subtilisin-like proprotein convertase family protein